MLNTVTALSTEPHVWSAANPYWVGGIVLAFFLLAIAILVAFGNGREHS